jgi:hypothetical protein
MESTTADEHDHLNSTLRSDSTMDEHSGPTATARAFYATVDAISADGRPIAALDDITTDDFVVHLPGADAANRDGFKAIVTSFRAARSSRSDPTSSSTRSRICGSGKDPFVGLTGLPCLSGHVVEKCVGRCDDSQASLRSGVGRDIQEEILEWERSGDLGQFICRANRDTT